MRHVPGKQQAAIHHAACPRRGAKCGESGSTSYDVVPQQESHPVAVVCPYVRREFVKLGSIVIFDNVGKGWSVLGF